MRHPNSAEALRTLKDKETRYGMIFDVLQKEGVPMTDRQIAYKLGFSDLNAVRPRLSELLQDEVLEEAGDTLDHLTGVRVRTVRIKEMQLALAGMRE